MELTYLLLGLPLFGLLGIRRVPQGKTCVVFRQGKQIRVVRKGVFWIMPLQEWHAALNTNERTFEINDLRLSTTNQAVIHVTGHIHYAVSDPGKALLVAASNQVDVDKISLPFAVSALKQLSADQFLNQPNSVKRHLQSYFDGASENWGLRISSFEIATVEVEGILQGPKSVDIHLNTGKQSSFDNNPGEFEYLFFVDKIRIVVGFGLFAPYPHLVNNFNRLVFGLRQKLSRDFGFLWPEVTLSDDVNLPLNNYKILILGREKAEDTVYFDKMLAINPGRVSKTIAGGATLDPAFRLEAVWIAPSDEDRARNSGYEVVDAVTVIVTHLSTILSECPELMFSYEAAKQTLDGLSKSEPTLAGLLLNKFKFEVLFQVLESLLPAKISLKYLPQIAMALLHASCGSDDVVVLTQAVITGLGPLAIPVEEPE